VQLIQPDVVVVELCKSRINILSLDEQTLLHEAKNINLDKIRTAIRQASLHSLLRQKHCLQKISLIYQSQLEEGLFSCTRVIENLLSAEITHI